MTTKTDRQAERARFDVPLYTLTEAARYLDVPPSILASWAKGYRRKIPGRPAVVGAPVLTAIQTKNRGPVVPFAGLATGLVLSAIRQSACHSNASDPRWQ